MFFFIAYAETVKLIYAITYNLELTTYNLQLTTYNLQLTTYNLQPTTYNLQLTTYNLQPHHFHNTNALAQTMASKGMVKTA